MKTQGGFTLVELVIFIVVMSILSLGIMAALNVSEQHAPRISQTTEAAFLAQQRMEAIIAYKRYIGYNSFVDPCAASIYPAALCTVSGFTVSSVITTNWNSNANLKKVDVTVTGTNINFTLSTVLGNFE